MTTIRVVEQRACSQCSAPAATVSATRQQNPTQRPASDPAMPTHHFAAACTATSTTSTSHVSTHASKSRRRSHFFYFAQPSRRHDVALWDVPVVIAVVELHRVRPVAVHRRDLPRKRITSLPLRHHAHSDPQLRLQPTARDPGPSRKNRRKNQGDVSAGTVVDVHRCIPLSSPCSIEMQKVCSAACDCKRPGVLCSVLSSCRVFQLRCRMSTESTGHALFWQVREKRFHACCFLQFQSRRWTARGKPTGSSQVKGARQQKCSTCKAKGSDFFSCSRKAWVRCCSSCGDTAVPACVPHARACVRRTHSTSEGCARLAHSTTDGASDAFCSPHRAMR